MEPTVPTPTLPESLAPTDVSAPIDTLDVPAPIDTFDICVAMDQNGIVAIGEYGLITNPWLGMIPGLISSVFSLSPRIVIMGYRTWTSMTQAFRANPQRYCIIITRDPTLSIRNGDVAPDLDTALTHAYDYRQSTTMPETPILVLASPSITLFALDRPDLKHIRLACASPVYPSTITNVKHYTFPLSPSIMDKHLSCVALSDSIIVYAYSPELSTSWQGLITSREPTETTEPTTLPEQQYLDLVKLIATKGILKLSRNGSTRSIFGHQLRFDLSEGYPLLTVKRGYPKAVFEELMWMLRGQTDTRILRAQGIKIWDGNSTLAFLRERGLPYREGDIGPGYGFQIRHSGATYTNCESDYHNQGRDQLADCINLLRTNPTSRRIIIDLWNANDVDLMALPPCHMVYNFGVDLYESPKPTGSRGTLNCHLFQRSWDVLLGWNTTTAALLTYLLAHHCNLDPGVLVHSITDAHLYQSHIDSGAIKALLERTPRPPPTLRFKTRHEHIEDYQFNDTLLTGYFPAPAIVAEMVA
ncbi:Bifunctional dihydrofolate reductase/thymidylate synthase [uncultured virus]|nr:Bifunctional dihydrofolate reductase/thymidylate synthase [uncultured virus]